MGTVGAGDAAAGGKQTVHSGRQHTAVGDVIGDGGLGTPLGLTASGGIVDINEEPGVMYQHILLPRPGLHIVVRNHIIAHNPPGFPDPQGAAAALQLAAGISGDVFAKKINDLIDLPPELILRPQDALGDQRVVAVGLGSVDAALAGAVGAVDADDGHVLWQLAPGVGLLAEISEPCSVRQSDRVAAAPAGDAFRLIHPVQAELNGGRLTASVAFPAHLVSRSGPGGHKPVAGGVYHHTSVQGFQPVLGTDHQPLDRAALLHHLHYGSLKENIHPGIIDKFQKEALCLLGVHAHLLPVAGLHIGRV